MVAFATPIEVRGPDGRVLFLDGNSKITGYNGTFDEPSANAFSLVEVSDCPGSTPTCRAACYVQGLRKNAPETHALYEKNSRTIREILELPYTSVRSWAQRLGAAILENCSGGFRWHVSGDVFSLGYAYFIADACRDSSSIRHWIYTRSFDFIGPLVAADNLTVNLSCDRDNYRQARFARAAPLLPLLGG